jgi:hypothetical protein
MTLQVRYFLMQWWRMSTLRSRHCRALADRWGPHTMPPYDLPAARHKGGPWSYQMAVSLEDSVLSKLTRNRWARGCAQKLKQRLFCVGDRTQESDRTHSEFAIHPATPHASICTAANRGLHKINEMQRVLSGSGSIDALAPGNLHRGLWRLFAVGHGCSSPVSTPIHSYSRTLLDARHSSLNFRNSA